LWITDRAHQGASVFPDDALAIAEQTEVSLRQPLSDRQPRWSLTGQRRT